MKRPSIIACLGLGLALVGYGALYLGRTARDRELERKCGPELAWLRKDFQLSDTEFERIRTLHEAYKPVCAEFCRKIDEKNREMARLMMEATNVTPQLRKVLSDAAQLRAECSGEMIRHFLQVSQAMPAEQGRRYLSWMQSITIVPSHESMVPRVGPGPHDAHAHH